MDTSPDPQLKGGDGPASSILLQLARNSVRIERDD